MLSRRVQQRRRIPAGFRPNHRRGAFRMASEKTHTTALVLVPPRACWPSIQAIRSRHDRHARRWMPHVTLVYPFLTEAAYPALRPALLEAARTVDPFVVTLAKISYFAYGRGRFTLWLAPEPASAVDRLQAALQGAVPGCDDVRRHPGGFTPHLTLGQARGERERDDYLTAWRAAWRSLAFTADRVCFITRGRPPDDAFTVRDELPLGAATVLP